MDKAVTLDLLRTRLRDVEDRLATACRRAGRARNDVTLVAVTKTVSTAVAAVLPELGLLDLGENRPQELWRKAQALSGPIRWHMIGHLQRNKVEATLPLVSLIHSVDSVRLLQAVDEAAAKTGRKAHVLFEVNVAGEASKHGFTPEQALKLPAQVQPLRHVHALGLMTMAPLQEAEACRPVFARLRELRDELRERFRPPHDLRHLSMGMSNDFEEAVEEGATLVRLGSALFEGLDS